MPERHIEDDGVVAVRDCLFYCLIDRLFHQRVFIAVRKPADNQSAQVGQHSTHPQVAHHAVDMIMAFADIFDQENRKLVTEFRQSERCALESVEDR